jgi:hypothetical protein
MPNIQKLSDYVMTELSNAINFIQFKAIDEPWNDFKLEDGSIIRLRIVLGGLIKEKNEGTFSLQSTNVFNVIPNPKYVGIPSPPLKQGEKLADFIEAEDLRIVEKTEKWNRYELPSERMILNVLGVLVLASRTSRHDEIGIPTYATNIQILIKPKKLSK